MSNREIALQIPVPEAPLKYYERGFIMTRKETVAFCDDPTEAWVFRIIESYIELAQHRWCEMAKEQVEQGKPLPRMPKTWWVTITCEQIKAALYGYVSDLKTVMKRLSNLIKHHIIVRRRNPSNPGGAPQYAINIKVAQNKINALQKRRPPQDGGLKNADLEPDEEGFDMSDVENDLPDPINGPPQDGGLTKQVQKADEGTPKTQKNKTDLHRTEVSTPKKREIRPPQDGDIGNKEIDIPRINNPKERKDSTDVQQLEQELTNYILSFFPPLSLRISVENFRTMPEGPEAILAGLAQILPIPDGEAIKASGNQTYIDWYDRWVWQPVLWIYEHTKEVPLVYSWTKQIHRRARGAIDPGARTWLACERIQSSPLLPLHIVGKDKKTGKPTGNQWRALEREMNKANNWYPNDVIAYVGPGYEVGYSGTTEETGQENVFYSAAAKTSMVEVVAQPGEDRKKTQPLNPEQAPDIPPDDTPPSGPPRGGKRRPSGLPAGLPPQVAMAIEACRQSQEEQDREKSVRMEQEEVSVQPAVQEKTIQAETKTESEQKGGKSMGMSEEERDQLIKLMREHSSTIHLSTYTTDAGLHVVGMAHGDREDDWWDVYSVEEWDWLRKEHPDVIEKAVEYGRQLAGVTAQPETLDEEQEKVEAEVEQVEEGKEESVYPIGMSQGELQGLVDQILEKYPNFQGESLSLPDGSYVLQVYDSDETSFKIWQSWQWLHPSSKEMKGRIIRAKVYAREMEQRLEVKGGAA